MSRFWSRTMVGLGIVISLALALVTYYVRFMGRAIPLSRQGVIFTSSLAAQLASPCVRKAPIGSFYTWPTSIAEVRRLWVGLPRYMETYGITPSEFLCQYAALKHDGKRVIYVNAFWKGIKGAEWRQAPVDACTGGVRFWSVEFDVVTGGFSNVSSNDPSLNRAIEREREHPHADTASGKITEPKS